MADPMSAERLAEIRQLVADYRDGAVWKFFAGAVKDVPALLAEVERLRAELAAFAPAGRLAPGETPALCSTCKEALCVPGLPGCAACVRERLESAETGERTADSQVEALHAELNDTRRAAHRDRLAADGAIGRIEQLAAERDQAEADVDRAQAEQDSLAERVRRGLELARQALAQEDLTLPWVRVTVKDVIRALDGTETGQTGGAS